MIDNSVEQKSGNRVYRSYIRIPKARLSFLIGDTCLGLFVRQGDQAKTSTSKACSLFLPGSEWNVMVDFNLLLKFLWEINTTSWPPDNHALVLSRPRMVLMVKLMIPWEDGMMEAFQKRKSKHMVLEADRLLTVWRAVTFPVEVVCYTGASSQRLSMHLGIKCASLKRAIIVAKQLFLPVLL